MPKGTGWSYDKVYENPRQPMTLDEMAKIQKEYEKPLIEAVARAIYDAETEEYQTCMGETRRVWKLTPEVPWDSDGREIAEWERDDYRMMAAAAIQAMRVYQRKQEKDNK